MIRSIRWGTAIVILAVVAMSVTAAGREADPGKASYQRFQGGPPVSPFPTKPAPVEKQKSKAVEPARPSETSMALRAQEEANLLRRLAVCDKLKAIAMETGDTKMEEQALAAEARANEVYRLRLAAAAKPATSDKEKP